MGCYGNDRIATPNLDRLAADGARFDNAYIGSYPCMPARHDLFTGQLNFLWRGWSPLEYDQDDFITAMKRHQKTSMLITDHYHLWQYGAGNYHFAFDGMELVRGQEVDNWITNPDVKIEYPASPDKLNDNWHRYARNTGHFRSEEQYFAAQVFQKSIDWVEQNRNLQDFFLMIDCFDPHEPFDPPPGYVEKYDPDYDGERPYWPKYGDISRFTPEELRHIHALYCGEITFVDRWFGKFYDKLHQLGLLDNTMVIVTSDHGFLFGEHDWLGKHARILYQDIARTPLLVRHPAIAPGTVYRELVQMADLTPTILQTLDVPVPETMHGKSLVPLWDERAEEPEGIGERSEIIFGAFGGPVYCTDGEWLLVKKPVPGNTPLYWYTRSHYNNWDFGQITYPEQNKARLQQWDGTRFPTQYEQVCTWHTPPRMIQIPEGLTTTVPDPEDELYNVGCDHAQSNERFLENPEHTERLKRALSMRMASVGSPEEQWQRLGLERAD
jgi:arylsulfatase A-like enzyme